MRFVNATDRSMCFEINDVEYCVGVGDFCEIPDRFAYCVTSRGLPLTEAPAEVPVIEEAKVVEPDVVVVDVVRRPGRPKK